MLSEKYNNINFIKSQWDLIKTKLNNDFEKLKLENKFNLENMPLHTITANNRRYELIHQKQLTLAECNFCKNIFNKYPRKIEKIPIPYDVGSYGLNNCFWISLAVMVYVKTGKFNVPEYYMGIGSLFNISNNVLVYMEEIQPLLELFGVSIYSIDTHTIMSESYHINPVYMCHGKKHIMPSCINKEQKRKIDEYMKILCDRAIGIPPKRRIKKRIRLQY